MRPQAQLSALPLALVLSGLLWALLALLVLLLRN